MPEVKANEARFYFKAAAGKFSVLDFEGRDAVSEPYYFKIRLKAEDASVDPADLVKKRARLTLLTNEKKERYINGIVVTAAFEGRAEVREEAENYAVYSVELQPMFWLLGFRRQSRIFQKMSVPDIVSDVLKKAGMGGGDFKMTLTGSYQPREYCVQYRETDLDFVSRLISEEGIFYFFKQEADREVMVFGDDITAHPECVPDGSAEYHSKTGHLGSSEEKETLHECSMRVGVYSGKVTVNDYNYEKPDMQLRFPSSSQNHNELEVYDHPAGHLEPGHGQNLAKAKRDAEADRSRTITGRGIFRCLAAGHKLKIEKHPEDRFNKLFVILEMTHSGRQPQAIKDTTNASLTYEAEFSAVPAEVPIRPPKVIPKPRISIQTAVVVGPSGEEIYTDEHCRVKVQFYWDRDGKNDENSSCWIRASQLWAGAGWGAMYIPRIGQEVLVDFVEGDPDEPIIVGRVYNGRNLPPYPGEKTKSTIKSNSSKGGGGFNEFRYEDKKGEEEVYLQAEKDWNTLVKNNRSTTIGANDTLTVGANRTKMVGSNETNTIGMNRTSTVASGNDVLSIGSNRVKNIGGTETVTIQGGSGSDECKDEDPGKAIAKGAAIGGAIGMGIMGGIGALAGAAAGAAIAAFKEAVADKGSVSRNVTIVKGDDVLLLQEGSRKVTLVEGDDELTLSDGSRNVNVEQGDSVAKSPKGLNQIDSKDIELVATNSILLKCGDGSIFIDDAGNIQIDGPKISINGTALVDIKGKLVKINS